MADPRMPEEMIAWMTARNWGSHHEQWHVERRWDFWHALAAQGDSDATEVVEYAQAKGWGRASPQEGERGNGLEFLGMHRAMLLLLLEQFPQHRGYLQGWPTPPQDPADTNDPVPSGKAFDPEKAEAVNIIEAQPGLFDSEDSFGIFVETNLRPTPGNPLQRSPDPRTGIHNWLHNRWTDTTSDINLGDPTVNTFNARFWRLHGWLDAQWTRFRAAKGLSDNDSTYKNLIAEYRKMMEQAHHHHEHLLSKAMTKKRPAALRNFFRDAGGGPIK